MPRACGCRSARLRAACRNSGKTGDGFGVYVIALSLPTTDLGNHERAHLPQGLAVTCGVGKRGGCDRLRAQASMALPFSRRLRMVIIRPGDADASAAIGDDVAIAWRGARHSRSRRWLL